MRGPQASRRSMARRRCVRSDPGARLTPLCVPSFDPTCPGRPAKLLPPPQGAGGAEQKALFRRSSHRLRRALSVHRTGPMPKSAIPLLGRKDSPRSLVALLAAEHLVCRAPVSGSVLPVSRGCTASVSRGNRSWLGVKVGSLAAASEARRGLGSASVLPSLVTLRLLVPVPAATSSRS